MIALSIALVVIACIAGYLVNKHLDNIQSNVVLLHSINTVSAQAELSAAIDEMHKQFDNRINKAFENHQFIKTELDSLKMQIALRNK